MAGAMWADDLAPFGIDLFFEDDRAVIRLRGDVDVATGGALVDAATSAVARYERVEIDLSAVSAIGDHGVRALVKVRRFAEAHGAVVAVVAASTVALDALVFAGAAAWLGLRIE